MTAFAFFVCLFATAVGAITGIGGGIIIKPVLELTGALSVGELSFLSGLCVLAMSGATLARGPARRELRERAGILTALGGAAGGVAGKALFDLTGAGVRAGLIQAVVLGVLTLLAMAYVPARRAGRIRTLLLRPGAPAVCAGLGLGLISAFLGIGGGPVNVMALSYLFSLDGMRAGARSLVVIFFSQLASLLSALLTGNIPAFEWGMLAAMVAAGLIGGTAGGCLRAKMDERQEERVFVGLMGVILVICAVNAARYAGAF